MQVLYLLLMLVETMV